jgi:hypothetical protein
MHRAPYSTSRLKWQMRQMARTAGFTVVYLTGFLAAGIAAGAAVATGVHAVSNAGPPDPREQGAGAAFVGFSAGAIVVMAMRIAYVLHERRAEPDKTYTALARGGKIEYGLTRKQYARRLGSVILLVALFGCAGLLVQLEAG